MAALARNPACRLARHRGPVRRARNRRLQSLLARRSCDNSRAAMRNIKLTLAYDGSEFSGWQVQPGRPTIQGVLADVGNKLTQENLQVFGAGRTDAGVHALGQVAHFRTQSALSSAQFQRAFNALLPPAIRVVGAEEVGPDFHARWNAQAKTYQYRIHRARVLPPSELRYVLHDPFPLDAHGMARAARLFEGEHDFTSFTASTGSEEGDRDRSPVREIFSSRLFARKGSFLSAQGFLAATCAEEISAECPAPEVRGAGPIASPSGRAVAPADNFDAGDAVELIYAVRGKSFLRYMVRKIVGTLLEVGRGRLAPDDIREILDAHDRSRSGPTAPPQGLYLVSVEYPEPWKW